MCNNTCPFHKFTDQISNLAISTTNCSLEENCFETIGPYNKVCLEKTETIAFIPKAFWKHCGQYGKNCITAKYSKISFNQCYLDRK